MNTVSITEKEFKDISGILYERTGIFLPDPKRYLVVHRLMKRLSVLNFNSFKQYVDYLKKNLNTEMQYLIDNLTTNETFFFQGRETF
jgi:chemotaxis protein methyltransferase CheR